jgi:hypothetical protein
MTPPFLTHLMHLGARRERRFDTDQTVRLVAGGADGHVGHARPGSADRGARPGRVDLKRAEHRHLAGARDPRKCCNHEGRQEPSTTFLAHVMVFSPSR